MLKGRNNYHLEFDTLRLRVFLLIISASIFATISSLVTAAEITQDAVITKSGSMLAAVSEEAQQTAASASERCQSAEPDDDTGRCTNAGLAGLIGDRSAPILVDDDRRARTRCPAVVKLGAALATSADRKPAATGHRFP